MTYNTTGRRIRTENLADPATVTLSYDAMGRQTRAVDAAGVTTLAYPNGLTASWAYGSRGELLEVDNALPSGSVSKYAYTYDAAGRRITCARSGTAFTTPDTYAYLYNARSELTNATAMVDTAYSYGYQFDDIGNRETASERGTNSVYEANNLNQYTSVNDFVPQFDADGNQTLVKTSTGIWSVTYNGENRPVRWVNGDAVITMSYDRIGRRIVKNDQCFIYNGYLQIADNVGNAYVWDVTEPAVTRPLVWYCGNSFACYLHDGNKNVSDIIASDGSLVAHYGYTPYGAVAAQSGALASLNPFRFSSEYAEDDTATAYYNYRHYEPMTGRWVQRDVIGELGGMGLFCFVGNNSLSRNDILGLKSKEIVCDENHVDEIRATSVVRFSLQGQDPEELDKILKTIIALLMTYDIPLPGKDDVFSIAYSDINTIIANITGQGVPSGSDVALEILQNYKKIKEKLFYTRDVEVWFKGQCQRCKCRNPILSKLARLSTFGGKNMEIPGVLPVGLHYTSVFIASTASPEIFGGGWAGNVSPSRSSRIARSGFGST